MNILAFDTCFVSCSAAVLLAAGDVARSADQFELMASQLGTIAGKEPAGEF